MKKHITILCLFAVVLILAPLNIALGIPNGGCSVQAKISTPHEHGVNSWVEGYTWFDYPEATYVACGVWTWLLKLPYSAISESHRATYDWKNGPAGQSKYVAAYGSNLGVYDHNGANFGEQFQTYARSWNHWTINGNFYEAGHDHYSSTVTIS